MVYRRNPHPSRGRQRPYSRPCQRSGKTQPTPLTGTATRLVSSLIKRRVDGRNPHPSRGRQPEKGLPFSAVLWTQPTPLTGTATRAIIGSVFLHLLRRNPHPSRGRQHFREGGIVGKFPDATHTPRGDGNSIKEVVNFANYRDATHTPHGDGNCMHIDCSYHR